jgi:hypothetical protein
LAERVDAMKLPASSTLFRLSGLCILAGLFAFSAASVKHYQRQVAPQSLNIVLSPIVQMFMAGGDRFLAANIAIWRATVFPLSSVNAESVQALAQVQVVASQLNPANEDNYYTAQGILPWYGEIEPTSKILSAAADSRKTDFLPLFFLGFNAMYFEKNFTESGAYLERAALRMQGQDKLKMQALAAKFYEKGDDPDFAIQVIRGMQENTRSQALKDHLQIRLIRLEMLKFLRAASSRFEARFQRPPAKLEELVTSGIVENLPIDPMGVGFELSPSGVPALKLRK